MTLLIITGPQAVGKMTVGQEISKLTGMKLYHNHMQVDIMRALFDGGFENTDMMETMGKMRNVVLEGIAKSQGHPGLIKTVVVDFDDSSDVSRNLTNPMEIFKKYGHDVIFLELESDLETRLKRNVTENRLAHKPTKRNLEESEGLVRSWEEKYRMNSDGDFPYPEKHLKINNTHISPSEVAREVVKYFKLDV